jgi:hypothetical protein
MGLSSTNDSEAAGIIENELRAAIAVLEAEVERLTQLLETERRVAHMIAMEHKKDAAEVQRLQRENGALARTYAACEEMLRERTEQLNSADAAIDQTWRPEVTALRADVIAALEQNERFANTIATLRARIDAHNDEWRECPVIES